MNKNNLKVIGFTDNNQTLSDYLKEALQEIEDGTITDGNLRSIVMGALVGKNSEHMHKWYFGANKYELIGLIEEIKKYIYERWGKD